MAERRTADEVAQQYRDAMGPELGALFYRLRNECVSLHVKWDEYVILFGTKPERVEILNSAAGLFFRVVQTSLWEDVLLHTCRLTDPQKSAGKDNLTLRRLPPLIAPDMSQEVENLVLEARRRCDFARDWRKRRIAHLDLALALDQRATPLAAASRRNVKEALSSIVSVLDAVELHYKNTTTAYDRSRPRATLIRCSAYCETDSKPKPSAGSERIQASSLLKT